MLYIDAANTEKLKIEICNALKLPVEGLESMTIETGMGGNPTIRIKRILLDSEVNIVKDVIRQFKPINKE
jgi:hypothetical protein